jgi:hypothetical protein
VIDGAGENREPNEETEDEDGLSDSFCEFHGIDQMTGQPVLVYQGR